MRVLFASVVFVVVVVSTRVVKIRALRSSGALSSEAPGLFGGIVDALRHLDGCRRRSTGAVDQCLERDLALAVEGAMRNGGAAYRLNRYLTVEMRPAADLQARRSGDRGLGAQLVDVLNALSVHYRPVDEDVFEGRGKKKKDKKNKMGMMMAAAAMGMTMVGGMAMKMMLAKVLLIAVKALIIAKIALLLAGIMAIKKMMGGGGGGAAPATWSSGGGTEHGGYRRSYGQTDDVASSVQSAAADALAYRDQVGSQYDHNARYPH